MQSLTQPEHSLSEYLASLPSKARSALLSKLKAEERAALLYDWQFWARPKQLAPEGDWRKWLFLAGRGAGKTRAGAEWSRMKAETIPNGRGALVAATPADARDVMVEGDSGILGVCPPWNRPNYEPAKRKLTWPNGSIALIFSAFEPTHLRGPQFNWAWVDELASWKKAVIDMSARKDNPWDMLMFGLRLGDN
ncbi:MAG: terminase large subunit domain-containing protein, partial [Planctomycetota bacterium]